MVDDVVVVGVVEGTVVAVAGRLVLGAVVVVVGMVVVGAAVVAVLG